MTAWGPKRAAWAKRLKESSDVATVGQQLILLEEHLVGLALVPEWRAEVRDECGPG